MIQTLTIETLIAKSACAEAKEKFVQLFPNGALVAVATFVDVADQFDWSCAAKLLLSPRNQVRLRELISNAVDTARNARDTYDTSCQLYKSAFAARDARDAAYAAYSAAYITAFVTAFATLYIQQESKKS